MADTTQGDTDGQYLALLVLALIVLIPGLLIHSFIIGVNVTDWWKGRSITPVDHIVTSLGISRMCAQFISTIYMFIVKVFQRNLESHVTLGIFSIHDFFTYANFWLTSLLSIVFCLKISNLHTRLFLYLRGLILHRTGYLIVVSGLLSTFNSVKLLMMALTSVIRWGTYNTTLTNLSIDCAVYTDYIYNFTLGAFIPFLFYCISSVLLFTSLYHHTTKMKMSSNLSISLEIYYSAMRFVSITFIYNTLYFVGHFVGAYFYYFYCDDLTWLYIILGFLPVLHSSYLIYRTAKLRSQMSKILQNAIDFLLQRKNTKTRENIEVRGQ